jgi:hypothetical protein
MAYPMLPHEKALLLAARGAAFAEDEKAAGRAVTIAEAVRHVTKHGYPAGRAGTAASFAEGANGKPVNMINAVGVLAAELVQATPGLSQGSAVARIAQAARKLAWGGSTPSSLAGSDEASARGALWLAASHLSAGEPGLGFDGAIKRAAQSLRRTLLAGAAPGAAVASFAAPDCNSDALATQRVAAQVRRLCPSLSHQEALRFAARNPDT